MNNDKHKDRQVSLQRESLTKCARTEKASADSSLRILRYVLLAVPALTKCSPPVKVLLRPVKLLRSVKVFLPHSQISPKNFLSTFSTLFIQ